MKLLMNSLREKNPEMARIATTIFEASKRIWNPVQAPWYTDHGPRHTSRIVGCLEQLLFGVRGGFLDEPLSAEETLVLIGACCLHDIGMQYTRDVADLASVEELAYFTPVSRYFDTAIRRRHAHITHRLIWKSLSAPTGVKLLGLQSCPTELATAIAEVSLSHEIFGYLATLKDMSSNLRLDLLGALLQMGDLLDLSNERVNWQLINWLYLPISSRAHWLLSMYVASVTIDSQSQISVNYEVPFEIYRDAILAYDLREAIEGQWLEQWSREPRSVLESFSRVKLKLPARSSRYYEANQVMKARTAIPDEPYFDNEILRAWRNEVPVMNDEDMELVKGGNWPKSSVLRGVIYALLEYANVESQRRNDRDYQLDEDEVVETHLGVARACGISAEAAAEACDRLAGAGIIVSRDKKEATDVAARRYVLNIMRDEQEEREEKKSCKYKYVDYWLNKVREERRSLVP